MTNMLFLFFILTSPVTGAFWPLFSSHHHPHQVTIKDGHRVVIEFEERKVSISQPDEAPFGLDKLKSTVANAFKKTKEVIRARVPNPKAGEKAIAFIGKWTPAVGNLIGMASHVDDTMGTLKDSVVKLEEWDLVDSPKRIGQDIERNASLKIEQGVEEVKETVENIIETSPDGVLSKSKSAINDVRTVNIRLLVRSVIGWFHLLGFSTAYGMGVWVTFFLKSVLGKCLVKQEAAKILNTVSMVYFRAMGYCVGAALLGFLATRGCLSNTMEMFQGFNLVSALVMILTNLIFLKPRATKFIAQKMKGTSETRSVAAEKLKMINAYISTLNVSTMVVLTWHLAYVGQLLQARH